MNLKGLVQHLLISLKEKKALAILIWINIGISLLVQIFHLYNVISGDVINPLFSLLALPSGWSNLAVQPWSVLTYMFVQSSPLHLIFNLIALYWFGRLIYDSVGKPIVNPVILYFTCGIAAAVCFEIYLAAIHDTNSLNLLTGASGAAMGIMGFTATVMPSIRFSFFNLFNLTLRQIAIIIFIVSFLSGVETNSGGIAAHCGGLIAGILFALIYQKRRKQTPNPKFHIKLKPIENPDKRLDEILDKISSSGYSSLTEIEKNELIFITNHLKNRK